ncbi:hypothetical protein CC1G_05641 [Coprinopsis cinerea okayama7|uniref:Uncharacterized protein n=1 Tax=Coprinopsis cinerea (strain Okayama-7 / 130 / ATCC MYA-4618 / FGSC 9003) TaxID=240176 RepID=A8P1R6_COPC7|nr:hypothetical protein CC1G_05641 [Coprinopsis cinerea okayama7\|eukprot:XP_001838160.2 hypothetical protein CC1G_05641 [Coprinopsis cinerea okayama7\
MSYNNSGLNFHNRYYHFSNDSRNGIQGQLTNAIPFPSIASGSAQVAEPQIPNQSQDGQWNAHQLQATQSYSSSTTAMSKGAAAHPQSDSEDDHRGKRPRLDGLVSTSDRFLNETIASYQYDKPVKTRGENPSRAMKDPGSFRGTKMPCTWNAADPTHAPCEFEDIPGTMWKHIMTEHYDTLRFVTDDGREFTLLPHEKPTQFMNIICLIAHPAKKDDAGLPLVCGLARKMKTMGLTTEQGHVTGQHLIPWLKGAEALREAEASKGEPTPGGSKLLEELPPTLALSNAPTSLPLPDVQDPSPSTNFTPSPTFSDWKTVDHSREVYAVNNVLSLPVENSGSFGSPVNPRSTAVAPLPVEAGEVEGKCSQEKDDAMLQSWAGETADCPVDFDLESYFNSTWQGEDKITGDAKLRAGVVGTDSPPAVNAFSNAATCSEDSEFAWDNASVEGFGFVPFGARRVGSPAAEAIPTCVKPSVLDPSGLLFGVSTSTDSVGEKRGAEVEEPKKKLKAIKNTSRKRKRD